MNKVNTRVNDQIRAKEVRLLDQDGNQVGIFNINDALHKARSAGLDLVEISSQANPTVVKITDYGKFKYEQSKKDKEVKKKQRAAQIVVKELRFRPNTGSHDIDIMLKQAQKFLDAGNRVKFCLRVKGRETARLKELVSDMENVVDKLSVKYVSTPQISGKQITCIVEKT